MNRLTFTRPTSSSSSGRQKLACIGTNPRELETPAGLLRDIVWVGLWGSGALGWGSGARAPGLGWGSGALHLGLWGSGALALWGSGASGALGL